MVRVVFITPDGQRKELDVPVGGTLMQAARDNNIPGIEAECGGCMACGTCHVVVESAWYDKLPPAGTAERDILEFVVDPQPNMRLTCQLTVSQDLDGIVLHVPKAGH